VKLAVVTNSTYDGLCYNAELIKQQLGNSVEVLHFDEAWYAYAAFHEFFAGRYGMGTSRTPDSPLVFTTHSTHKLLAAFSQASMIHVQDGGARQLDRDRFNEAFMMHISTSPQYSIIASLDVASAMMEGPAGRSLLQEMFDEALSFRRALANLRQHIAAEDWWFSIWQPPSVAGIDRVATADWLLQPEDDWHGFGDVAEDYVLLDPIKVTLVMPGLTAGGALSDCGIPAAVVSKFLWERGLVVEKPACIRSSCCFPWASPRANGVPCSPNCWNSNATTTPMSALPVACLRYLPRAQCVIKAWGCATCATNYIAVTVATPPPNTSSGCTPCYPKSR